MTQVLMTAAARAITTAVVAAGSVFFAALQAGIPVKGAGIAAGAAFFAILAARLGVEGSWDAYRARQVPAPAPPAPLVPPSA